MSYKKPCVHDIEKGEENTYFETKEKQGEQMKDITRWFNKRK